MHEPKSVLGFACRALRAHVHRVLSRARNVLRTCARAERDSAGAPALRAQRSEAEPSAAQIYVPDLLRLDVDDSKTRVALARRPGDAENE
ncbi:hypothetical protein [Rhodococcus sovatensis]|uniref:Uncharacterized protein n=1 Tax=Rhodococcus sovatensis TaxID=1805840 RepID=A0ABZ2PQA4_9NOCA